MKVIYSLFLLAIVSLLINNVSPPKELLFNEREMREINRRLKSIGTL